MRRQVVATVFVPSVLTVIAQKPSASVEHCGRPRGRTNGSGWRCVRHRHVLHGHGELLQHTVPLRLRRDDGRARLHQRGVYVTLLVRL